MHKTIYIDTDEEIIGIINKIRRENADEIFLVVPKNSLLIQGIINLKLLKKEVFKMGKKIILVTSDEHSKRIIKRVGLETKNKSVEDFVNNKNSENYETTKITEKNNFEDELEQESFQKPQKREIGSSSFYGQNTMAQPTEKYEDDNGKEPFVKPASRKLKVIAPNTFGIEYVQNKENLTKEIKEDEQFIAQEKFNKIKSDFNANIDIPKIANSQKIFKNKETGGTIDDFYKKDLDFKENYFPPKIRKTPSGDCPKKKILMTFFTLLFLISLGSFGYWAFLNWPKMQIELFLKEEIIETNLDLVVCGEKTEKADCLSGDYKELIIEISEQYESTGEQFSNDKGMSRGIVKIYNNYSEKDQPLVASTRILSKEGKLFRLVKSVIVPGMTNNGEAGVVEAQVIADEIGQNYNIDATEFTIEGFKGGDKYEKFKVISEKSMVGGSNDNENKKVKIVTEEDINSAREKTINLFNEKLEEKISEQLSKEETFVLASVEKEILNSDSSYAPKDVTDIFNYSLKEKVKLITFKKDSFENILIASFEKNNPNNLKFNRINKTVFEKNIADYDLKKLNLNVSASAVYWPNIDENEIKNRLADKNGEEVKDYLKSLKQIDLVKIYYSPSWLTTLPIKNKNINIKQVQ